MKHDKQVVRGVTRTTVTVNFTEEEVIAALFEYAAARGIEVPLDCDPTVRGLDIDYPDLPEFDQETGDYLEPDVLTLRFESEG